MSPTYHEEKGPDPHLGPLTSLLTSPRELCNPPTVEKSIKNMFGKHLIKSGILPSHRLTSTFKRATFVILMARRPKFRLHLVSFTSPSVGATQTCENK